MKVINSADLEGLTEVEKLNYIYSVNRDNFMEERTKQEIALQKWADELAKVEDRTIFEGIEFPEEISLRTMIPEYYKENGNSEVAGEQYRVLMEFIDKIDEVTGSTLERAMAKQQEYTVFAGTR